jgi:hypothetical protein
VRTRLESPRDGYATGSRLAGEPQAAGIAPGRELVKVVLDVVIVLVIVSIGGFFASDEMALV